MAPDKSGSKPKGSHPSEEIRNQNQAKPTTQSSTSSSAYGRDTPGQHRGFGNPTFFAGTTAYTQWGVVETFGTERQRPSADKASTYKSTIEHHDLLDDRSQTFATSSMQPEPRTARVEEAFVCPYHGRILQEHPTKPQSGQGQDPMVRYLAEGPSERYAILHRPESGDTSTHNGCRCLEVMQGSKGTNDHAQK